MSTKKEGATIAAGKYLFLLLIELRRQFTDIHIERQIRRNE